MAGGRTTGAGQSRGSLRGGAVGRAFMGMVATLLAGGVGGCINQPALLPLARQRPIDRSLVECPRDFVLTPLVRGLNCPTALCFDAERGNLIVAESGIDGSEPHIFGYHLADGKYFSLYPFTRTVSFFPTGFVIYGPVGGMTVHNGRVYVSHRDKDGLGRITAFGYDGTHTTIVANLPAQGDYGVTDVVVHNHRLYFGVGTATNSGVVGLDNWDAGWVRLHPEACDQLGTFTVPPIPIKANGSRFDDHNPRAGLGQPDIVVTPPFEPFGYGNQSRIAPSTLPNGAIYSVGLDGGGDPQVEAIGLHNPRGLGVDEFNHLYTTNDGMQLRGSRPIANDPDVLEYVSRQANYRWPDYTTNGHPVTDPQYAPPVSMLTPHGYSELTPLIDAAASGYPPFVQSDFDARLAGVFPSLSGAAKLVFVPQTGPFAPQFGGMAIVALDGDRAPYASGGLKLKGFVGGQLDVVDVSAKQARDFVYNVARKPASQQPDGTVALERPCDVKFGPDGCLYILDFGQMDNDTAVPRYHPGTGAIYKLAPAGK